MQQLTRYDNRPRVSSWVILVFILVCFVLFCIPAHCQSTTVTVTAVDGAGTIWANGSWKLNLIPNPNSTQNISWNGTPLPNTQWNHAGVLNGSGAFSQSVPSTNFITPVGATYTLTVCPNATAPCTVITRLAVTGSTISFSSQFTAATPQISVKPLPIATAYNDSEVAISPSQVGYFYLNVTSSSPRYWGQDQAWHDFTSGVTTFSAGNLNPLFTTSVGSDPSNPALAFSLETAPPNEVYANCTGSTADPSFCALTAAMIPPLPYLPSSTNIFYQTVEANGTGVTQRGALNFTNFFSVGDAGTNTEVDAVHAGANKTCTNVSSQVIDIYGRVTSCTNGVAPTGKTVVGSVNFTSCALIHWGDTDQNCVATQSWGTTISGTYSISCIIGVPFTGGGTDSTGLTQTTWGLSGASPLGSTSFTYYLANQHDAAATNTVFMSCVAVQ